MESFYYHHLDNMLYRYNLPSILEDIIMSFISLCVMNMSSYFTLFLGNCIPFGGYYLVNIDPKGA